MVGLPRQSSMPFFTLLDLSRLEPIIYSYVLLQIDRQSASQVLSAVQNPKQADLIGRHTHTLLLVKESFADSTSFNSKIGSILSTCSSLRNLLFAPGTMAPEMMFYLLGEHAPPTLRRIRIVRDWPDARFTLSTIPQPTIQNLTHLELINLTPCDESYWQPLHCTLLQYFSFWCYFPNEHISLLKATFPHLPPTLKAFIIPLRSDEPYNERYLDKLDAWFCENQNDPQSSVVILHGYTIDGQLTFDSGSAEHKVWDSWAFLSDYPPWDPRFYDLCEELLPDGELTIWEEADRALEERRLRLASQVNGAMQE